MCMPMSVKTHISESMFIVFLTSKVFFKSDISLYGDIAWPLTLPDELRVSHPGPDVDVSVVEVGHGVGDGRLTKQFQS